MQLNFRSSAGLRPGTAILASSLWMAALANIPLWRAMHGLGLLDSAPGWGLALALAGMITVLLAALLSLFAWRWTLKPAILVLLVAAAAGAHFMGSYGIVIDGSMATNVLQTDAHEAGALLGTRLLLTLALLAGLPAAWLLRARIAIAPPARQALRNAAGAAGCLLAAVLLVLASFQPLASAMRNHKSLRYMINPLNTVYALASAAAGAQRHAGPPAPLGRDAQLAAAPTARPAMLVLVVGETARSDHFALNGYARPTTPELAAAGVVSWRNAWSCGTSTAASVPCMFSNLGRTGYSAGSGASENLLDVLQHAGLAVLWLDNQAGCKGVCDRVAHASTADMPHPGLCSGGECLDGALLDGLDARIAALPAAQRARGVVLVLHQMGSHGPAYAQRSATPHKRFLPECTSVQLSDCSAETLHNAYDNSIVATDHMLAQTIAWLRTRTAYDTALLYVSDHGESLGESNLYLHGLPYAIAPDVQKHVPWVTWLSPGFEQRSALRTGCLRARADVAVSHDNLFHSVLGLMQVRTRVYRPELDAYAPCANPADSLLIQEQQRKAG